MSHPSSHSPNHCSQSFVLASPNRVVFKTIPHPIAATNKRVTLSLRRTAPAAPAPLPPSSHDLFPHSHSDNDIVDRHTTPTPSHLYNSDPEDSATPAPRSSPNISHRRTMSSALTHKELADIAKLNHAKHHPVLKQVNTKQSSSSMGHGNTTTAAAETDDTATPASVTSTAAATVNMATPTTPTPSGKAQTAATASTTPVVRYHKNGLPLKSALKSPRSSHCASPSDSRPTLIRSHTSPAPLTSPKFVHFNTQLEHVRLFLQGETPASLADRETLIDSRQHEGITSNIVISLPNWSSLANVAAFDSNAATPLRCENVVLSDDKTKLCGTVLVQNIAFHKHVSVRFTVDFWQTHSEIGAEYDESIAGTALDRFKFEIPLAMEKTCIEKTFCMAIRYQVNGREFWDSNNGMNYQVECKRVVVVPSVSDITNKMGGMTLTSYLPEYGKPVLRKKNPANTRYDLSSSLSATITSRGTTSGNFNLSGNGNGNNVSTRSSIPVPTPSATGSQSPYRLSEYISAPIQSPPDFHRQLYASSPKFRSSYLGAASPPDHFRLGFEPVQTPSSPSSIAGAGNHNNGNKKQAATKIQWGFEIESPVPPVITRGNSFPPAAYSTACKSAPISIPTPSATAAAHGGNGRPAVGSASYYDLVDRYCFYESSPHSSPYSTYSDSPPAPCIRG